MSRHLSIHQLRRGRRPRTTMRDICIYELYTPIGVNLVRNTTRHCSAGSPCPVNCLNVSGLGGAQRPRTTIWKTVLDDLKGVQQEKRLKLMPMVKKLYTPLRKLNS